jgi:hypothetical protein
MTIYRGFDITQEADKSFSWKDESGNVHSGYATEEKAMDAIDAHRREARKAASA